LLTSYCFVHHIEGREQHRTHLLPFHPGQELPKDLLSPHMCQIVYGIHCHHLFF